MTLDEIFNNAKNGTQDAGYEDGHVSHRKNGDFIKQGGTWVPMKGQKQESSGEKVDRLWNELQGRIKTLKKNGMSDDQIDNDPKIKSIQAEMKTVGQKQEGATEKKEVEAAEPAVDLMTKDPYELTRRIKAESPAEAMELDKIAAFMNEEHATLRNALIARESFYKNTKNPTEAEQAGLSALFKISEKLNKGGDSGYFKNEKANTKQEETTKSKDDAYMDEQGLHDIYMDIKNNELEDYTVEEIAKEYKITKGDAEVIKNRIENNKRAKEQDKQDRSNATLASTFEAAKNNGWEETQMASGKLWDSPDGKQRIVERKDPESGESKYVLRPKSASDPAPDKSFNSLEEAFEAAKNGGEAPARKAVDNTTGSNFKKGQRVPNAGAIGQTYRHRERQYLAAHQKEADANPKEVTERRDVLASLVANSREQAQMYEAINGRSEGEGNEWEINSHTAEELNRLLKEEKQLQGKLKKLDKAPAAGPKKNDLAAEQTARNEAMKAAENESQNAAVFNDLNEKAATEGIEYKIRKTKAGEYYWDKYRDGKHVGGGTARDKTDAINRANKNFDEYIKENKKSAGSIDAAPLIEAQSVNAPGDSFKKKLTGDCKVKLSKIKR